MDITQTLLEFGEQTVLPKLISEAARLAAQHEAAAGTSPSADRISDALEKAINVITGTAPAKPWLARLTVRVRHGVISPDLIFRGESMRSWLDDALVRQKLRDVLTLRLIGRESCELGPALEVLARRYEEVLGDHGGGSRGAVAVVLDVLLAGIVADIEGDPGANVGVMMIQAIAETLLDRMDEQQKATRAAESAARTDVAAARAERILENAWPELRDHLCEKAAAAQQWVFSTGHDMERGNEFIQKWLNETPHVDDEYFEIIAADDGLRDAVANYEGSLGEKERAAGDYNFHVTPRTTTFQIFGRWPAIEAMIGRTDNEPDLEGSKRLSVRLLVDVSELCTKYGTSPKDLAELLNDESYKRDVAALHERVKRTNEQLQGAVDQLERKIRFFNRAFGLRP